MAIEIILKETIVLKINLCLGGATEIFRRLCFLQRLFPGFIFAIRNSGAVTCIEIALEILHYRKIQTIRFMVFYFDVRLPLSFFFHHKHVLQSTLV